MKRPACPIRDLVSALLGATLLLPGGCGESGDGEQTLVRGRRITLLDGPGIIGRFEPNGVRVHEVYRRLDRVQRMCMVVPADQEAVFPGLPIHPGARLVLQVGTTGPGRMIHEVEIRAEGREAVVVRQEVEASGAGWHDAAEIDLSSYVGSSVELRFRPGDGNGENELLVANPALLSSGVEIPLSETGPIVWEEVLNDLVESFDQARVTRQDAGDPVRREAFSFAREKRTKADSSQRAILAPPDSSIVYSLTVPEDAFLDLATFVWLPKQRDPGSGRFRITIDGQERFAIRTDYINIDQPDVMEFDRLTHRAEVDLSDLAGRTISLSVETERVGLEQVPVAPLVWKELRIKRRARLPRRLASKSAPNLILISIDTLRPDHLGCYGYQRATSPHLDELASRSLLFENAISASSWTLPATASLLTGLHPNTHGVLGNERSYLVDGVTTLPEVLRARGISTAAFSANFLVNAAMNLDQGFERFDHVFEDAAGVNRDLLHWIEERGPHQFFAYVHYMEPHSPYSAPGEYRQHFDPEHVETRDYSGPLPERWRTGGVAREFSKAELDHLISLYDAEIYYWDVQFRLLLDRLEQLGLLDHTLLIVTADHGEEFFEHGGLGHGMTLYQELIQVPLIFHDPRRNVGSKEPRPVSTAGLFNSVIRQMGVEEPGTAQVQALRPGREDEGECAGIYSSTESNMPTEKARLASVIRGHDKLITDILNNESELYDLASDPREQIDLSARSTRLADLEACLRDWYARTAEAFPAEWQPTVNELEEYLRKIGYLPGDAGD